eukprot:TRINITY_DN61_c0_g2_i1.p1 TRINITY_DN61_c0_g2~~TRINITY_DN61_c0_g2_i1.p1  ORF type:complete len:597 (-),score=116.68 TRINITY_DN61_c0_g2_i1:65-1855(-)
MSLRTNLLAGLARTRTRTRLSSFAAPSSRRCLASHIARQDSRNDRCDLVGNPNAVSLTASVPPVAKSLHSAAGMVWYGSCWFTRKGALSSQTQTIQWAGCDLQQEGRRVYSTDTAPPSLEVTHPYLESRLPSTTAASPRTSRLIIDQNNSKSSSINGKGKPSKSANDLRVGRPASAFFSTARLKKEIDYYSHFRVNPVNIEQFAALGKVPLDQGGLMSMVFLRNELPIRLAHLLLELDALPGHLSDMPSVIRVREMYANSFENIVGTFPKAKTIQDMSDDEANEILPKFSRALHSILVKHNPVVTTMAQGILELKEYLKQRGMDAQFPQIHYFLDRFFMSRIGIRVLMSQHLELFHNTDDENGESPSPNSRWVGVIDLRCDVRSVAEDAADRARFLCEQYYSESAPINIVTIDPEVSGARPAIHFPYVPGHLYHILFELLKNSLRASVELHGSSNEPIPPIKVVIVRGEQDLTVKISDEGGGIPKVSMHKIFSYAYTTASTPILPSDFTSDMNHAPLAGFGYGLPLSRLYARYFGGDLQMISMEGFGTDAYVHLKVAAKDAAEQLPSFREEFNTNYPQGRPDPTAVWGGAQWTPTR